VLGADCSRMIATTSAVDGRGGRDHARAVGAQHERGRRWLGRGN